MTPAPVSDWLVAIDATMVRAHQHAAGAQKGDRARRQITPSAGPESGWPARSTLACDGAGRPPAFVVTAGNIDDCTRLRQVLDATVSPASGPAGRGPAPATWWPTRDTAPI